MLKKIKSYFSEGLWNFFLSEKTGLRAFLIKWIRIVYLAGKGFLKDKCGLSAAFLTYYSLMALVPYLAMTVALASVLGIQEMVKEELLRYFQSHAEVLSELFHFAERSIQEAKRGVVTAVSSAVLLFSALILVNSIEEALNQVWGVQKLRSWKRQLTDYFAFLLIFPPFFVFSSLFGLFLERNLGSWLPALFFFWLLFSFVYFFLPNTKVMIRSACIAGFITATLFLIVQWGYFHFQQKITNLNVIYGTMAALPLFLIWMKLNWLFFLLGGEISYAYQMQPAYEFEKHVEKMSHRLRRLSALWILNIAIKKQGIHREELVQNFQLPVALVERILHDLVASNLVEERVEGHFPKDFVHQMKISEIIEQLDFQGVDFFPFLSNARLQPFEATLGDFSRQIKGFASNVRMCDVPNTF